MALKLQGTVFAGVPQLVWAYNLGIDANAILYRPISSQSGIKATQVIAWASPFDIDMAHVFRTLLRTTGS